MKNGKGHRAMKLVLRGDDQGIEETPVGSSIQSISQRDRGAELNHVDHQAKRLHTHANLLRIFPEINNNWHKYTRYVEGFPALEDFQALAECMR